MKTRSLKLIAGILSLFVVISLSYWVWEVKKETTPKPKVSQPAEKKKAPEDMTALELISAGRKEKGGWVAAEIPDKIEKCIIIDENKDLRTPPNSERIKNVAYKDPKNENSIKDFLLRYWLEFTRIIGGISSGTTSADEYEAWFDGEALTFMKNDHNKEIKHNRSFTSEIKNIVFNSIEPLRVEVAEGETAPLPEEFKRMYLVNITMDCDFPAINNNTGKLKRPKKLERLDYTFTLFLTDDNTWRIIKIE